MSSATNYDCITATPTPTSIHPPASLFHAFLCLPVLGTHNPPPELQYSYIDAPHGVIPGADMKLVYMIKSGARKRGNCADNPVWRNSPTAGAWGKVCKLSRQGISGVPYRIGKGRLRCICHAMSWKVVIENRKKETCRKRLAETLE